MEELANYRRGLIKQYQEIGAEVESIAERLTVEKLNHFQEGTGWNAHHIFSHMRDVEGRYFLPFIKRVLVGEQTELGVFEDVEKREEIENNEEHLHEIISDLQGNHRLLFDMLCDMSLKDWNRTGRYQRSGIHTVQWYLEQNLAHLKAHIKQLAGQENQANV